MRSAELRAQGCDHSMLAEMQPKRGPGSPARRGNVIWNLPKNRLGRGRDIGHPIIATTVSHPAILSPSAGLVGFICQWNEALFGTNKGKAMSDSQVSQGFRALPIFRFATNPAGISTLFPGSFNLIEILTKIRPKNGEPCLHCLTCLSRGTTFSVRALMLQFR